MYHVFSDVQICAVIFYIIWQTGFYTDAVWCFTRSQLLSRSSTGQRFTHRRQVGGELLPRHIISRCAAAKHVKK